MSSKLTISFIKIAVVAIVIAIIIKSIKKSVESPTTILPVQSSTSKPSVPYKTFYEEPTCSFNVSDIIPWSSLYSPAIASKIDGLAFVDKAPYCTRQGLCWDGGACRSNTYNEVFATKGYDYTKEQASDVCQSFGATLASKDQVIQAFNDGADWCSAGWVSDSNIAIFPNQSNKSGCGSPGIKEYGDANLGDKRGVNCYGRKPDDKKESLWNWFGDIYKKAETAWQCKKIAENSFMAVSKANNNDVQCLSENGIDCVNNITFSSCQSMVKNPQPNLQPLVCDNSSNNWCSIASQKLPYSTP